MELHFNSHTPLGHKLVAVIERWLLYRGMGMYGIMSLKLELGGCNNEVAVLQSGRYTEVYYYSTYPIVFPSIVCPYNTVLVLV